MRLIDADALIFDGLTDSICQAQAEDVVAGAPTIEPKRGRWIENGIEIKCSECGEGWEASEGWKKDDIKKFFRYCSSCGARMEAEE